MEMMPAETRAGNRGRGVSSSLLRQNCPVRRDGMVKREAVSRAGPSRVTRERAVMEGKW